MSGCDPDDECLRGFNPRHAPEEHFHVFEAYISMLMVHWSSWLSRMVLSHEVTGSNPVWTTVIVL